MAEASYKTIREALPIIGKTVVEVTCDDHGDPCCERCPGFHHLNIHFDDFSTLAVHYRSIGEAGAVGFHYDGIPGDEV